MVAVYVLSTVLETKQEVAEAKGVSDLPSSIAEAKEGPAALYVKGRRDGLYRQVRYKLLIIDMTPDCKLGGP